jgi:HlyD family secretion protein
MDRKVRTPWWRSRLARFGAAGLVGLAVLVWILLSASHLTARSFRVPAATVTISEVQPGVFHDFTPLQGKVTPKDTLYIDALQGGQVQAVLVQAGDQVAAGQPLIRFINRDVELDVLNRQAIASQSLTQTQQYQTQLEANHAANERALNQIDYDIARLKRALSRRSTHEGEGVFPQEEIDQFRDELALDLKQRPVQAASNRAQDALRLAQLPVIREELTRLQQSLTQIRSRLDDLTVKAPMKGRITVLDLKIGQTSKPGDRLAELVPDTGVKLTVNVDEYYLGRVKVGQIADCQIDDKTWKLRVTRVYPQVKDGTFVVDLVFDGATPKDLQPGQTISGRLSLGGDKPALLLPAGPFLERSGGDWVMVMDGDNKALRRRIKIGRRNVDQVEIVSGLAAGDRVITSDYTPFEKMDRVDLTK